MSKPIPEGTFPARLEPRWYFENGSRKGQRLAGSQLVELDKWDSVLSDKVGIGGMLLNPMTKAFYTKFKEDILKHSIPELVRPRQPEGPGKNYKIVNHRSYGC